MVKRNIKLDGCIVWNAHNTVFGSKRSAICATVELSYNIFFKLNDLHISTSVPATWKRRRSRRTGAHSQIKSTGIVANKVANVVAALLTHRLPTMLVQYMTQFPVILLNDLSFPSPDVGNAAMRLATVLANMACLVDGTRRYGVPAPFSCCRYRSRDAQII